MQDAVNQAGFVHSLRRLGATALDVLHTRLELLISEVEEERLRLLQLLLWGSAALIFFAFALLLFTFAVVLYFWETHRVLATLALATVYLALAASFAVGARRRMQRPRLFAASMTELSKDRDTLEVR